jgi:type VI secretion system secreted protein Hcp
MAVDAFIKFEKAMAAMADIKGECTDPTFKDYFEIKDFSFGAENATTIGSATGGAGAGKIKFNEFTIKKPTDTASPYFFRNCAAGAHYKKVTLAIRKSGGMADRTGKPFLVFNFGTVFTTKIDWSGPGDEGPEESITFVYGALDVAYAQQKPDGSMEPLKNTSWSQVTNKSEFIAGVVPTSTF